MSNHEGSYLLNEVIEIMADARVFELLGRERTQELILQITQRGVCEYDCNASEILARHGERFGICHYYRSPAEDLNEGICPAYRKAPGR